MTRLRPAVYLFAAVLGLWFVCSGHYSLDHQLLFVLGLFSTALVVILCRRMEIIDDETVPLHLTVPTLRYIPWLTWQVIQSCWDVLSRTIHPRLPIEPQTLVVDAGQESALGKVTFANSITLTPGTISLYSDTANSKITVHAIDRSAADDLRGGEMDRRVTRIGRPS